MNIIGSIGNHHSLILYQDPWSLLNPEIKTAKISVMNAEERLNLPNELVHFYYLESPLSQRFKVNPAHMKNVVELLPPLPFKRQQEDIPSLKGLLRSAAHLFNDSPKPILTDYKMETFKRLSFIISIALGEKKICKKSLLEEDSQLIVNNLKILLKEITFYLSQQDLDFEKRAATLMYLIKGEENDDWEQMYLQAHDIYLIIMKCKDSKQRVYKSLHSLRNQILNDIIYQNIKKNKDKEEDYADYKISYLERFGIEIGHLTTKLLLEPQPISLESAHVYQIYKKKFFEEFNEEYIINRIINYLSIDQINTDLNLKEWFMNNPPLNLRDKPLELQNFVDNQVFRSENQIKKEYLMLMLDHLEVIGY